MKSSSNLFVIFLSVVWLAACGGSSAPSATSIAATSATASSAMSNASDNSSNASASSSSASGYFAKGADVSWMTEMEASGKKFHNSAGEEQDLLQILKDKGMNAARLRVWVNPANDYNSITDVLAKAKRVKAAGMKLMIDFHYSDAWADPGKQTKPAAWAAYNADQINTAIYRHTQESLLLLRDADVTPDWVQVGNETNDGFLWDEGRASMNMKNYARFTATGYDAVKFVFPQAQVVVHISNCHDNGLFRWIFDGLKNNGGKFDVIGASTYPTTDTGKTWQQTLTACDINLKDMINRYQVPVMIAEVGAPWDYAEAKTLLSTLIQNVKALPDNKGLGVFYWEPESYGNWKGYSLGAFDNSGKPGVQLDAFKE
jgi:arabinogalactan endo-1,4-beta-galactosidase